MKRFGILTHALLVTLSMTNPTVASTIDSKDQRRLEAKSLSETPSLYAKASVYSRNTTIQPKDISSPTNEPALENELVRILFDKGKGHLLSFIDRKTETELLSDRTEAWPVILGLGYRLGNQDSLWTDSNRASRFSYNLQRRAEGTEFQGIWTFDWRKDGAVVKLTVLLPAGSSFSKWQVQVEMTGNATLDRVAAPMLAGIGKLGDWAEDDRLLVPDQNGRLFTNPSQRLRSWERQYPSGFANMQFMAYYDDRVGFYLSSLDTRGLTKTLSWSQPDMKWAVMAETFQGLSGTGNNKAFQTELILGSFHGDWTTAASIYKHWANEQIWCKSTIVNKGTPGWLTGIGISKSYAAHELPKRTYSDWVQKIEEHMRFFDVPTLAYLCGWEHGGFWASGDYFPPQESWVVFDRALHGIRSLNAVPFLPIAAITLRVDTPVWESDWGQEAALRDVHSQTVGERDIVMCLESAEWLNYLRETAFTLAEHGVGLAQLDGLPWTPSQPCYAKSHRHGTVPGCVGRPWEVVGNFLSLRSALQSRYPNVALSGEGGVELYLPVLDVYASRDCWAEVADTENVGSGLAQVVPLFHFVYHPHIIFLGDYNLGLWRHLGGAAYHNLAVGRSFVWGEICGYNMQDWLADQGNQPIFGLLKRCAKARVGFLRDFLVLGRMLRPPQLEAPLIEVESQGGKFRGKVPSALCSAWQSEHGDVAVIVLNISLQPFKTFMSLSTCQQYIEFGSEMEIYLNNDLIKSVSFDKDTFEQWIELKSLEFASFVLRKP